MVQRSHVASAAHKRLARRATKYNAKTHAVPALTWVINETTSTNANPPAMCQQAFHHLACPRAALAAVAEAATVAVAVAVVAETSVAAARARAAAVAATRAAAFGVDLQINLRQIDPKMPAVANATRVALVAGATGLVGQAILALLLADTRYSAVHVVGRRAPDVQHQKLVVHISALLTEWVCPAVDDVFIALGTTIKVAGSKAAFKAIDGDTVAAIAAAAKAAGAIRLGVVSAMGASTQSGIFYNQVKGEMEVAVSELGFDTLVIARPSLLAGDRDALKQPERMAEKLSLVAFKWLKPLIPANYRAIKASSVAQAMVSTLQATVAGKHVLLSGDMQK